MTDVGTLAPGRDRAARLAIRIAEGARAGAGACGAGAAAGLAIGFKYTAGLVLLAPGLAIVLPLLAGRAAPRCAPPRSALLALAGGTLAGVLRHQPVLLPRPRHARCTSCAARPSWPATRTSSARRATPGRSTTSTACSGASATSPPRCALAGAVLLARRDRARLALLLIFPVALFLYLSVQSRFFGRWLLPVYPVLALLAGYAFVRGARAGSARARAALAVAGGRRRRCVLLLWQPLAADARSMAVLGNEDTRAIARQWLAEQLPPRAARRDRARGARALPLARRATAARAARARAVRQRVHPRHPRGRTSSTAARCARACSTATAPRLLHGDDVRPDPRPRGGGRRPRGARLLRPARARVRPGLPRSARTARTRTRRRSASTSATATTRPPTSGPGRRCASTGCTTARRATGRGDRDRRRRAALLARRRSCWSRSALRLWHIRHGLPFAYNADEAEHFVPKAVGDVRRRARPGLLREPVRRSPTCSTLVASRRLPRRRPLARTSRDRARSSPRASSVALIGTLVVGLTYWAGTRYADRRAGLVAAALMAVAFLPVFYSKHALNDVVTLAPVTRRARRLPARVRARPLGRLGARGRRDRRGDRDEVHGRARCC